MLRYFLSTEMQMIVPHSSTHMGLTNDVNTKNDQVNKEP